MLAALVALVVWPCLDGFYRQEADNYVFVYMSRVGFAKKYNYSKWHGTDVHADISLVVTMRAQYGHVGVKNRWGIYILRNGCGRWCLK